MANDEHIMSTRRGVLALVGTTALAGCNAIPTDPFGEHPIQLDGAKLQALAEQEIPTIPERVVVDIEQSYLDSRRARIRELLAAVPTPFSSREIPNGAIREELASMHRRTLEMLDAADDAESRYETLTSLRNVRSQAGELNTAWQAIDADLTREALLEDSATVRQGVRAFDDSWQYVGTDAVRAVLIADRIERSVERAIGVTSVDREELKAEQENPITVGELGGDIEQARALLDDSVYLYDRYTTSLTDPTDLSGTIRSAAASAVGAIEARQDDLPEFNPENPAATFGQDIEDTPAAWALEELYDYVSETYGIDHARSNDQPARVILEAQEAFARMQAFTSLYERIDEGERFAIEAVSDVKALRSTAVEAVTAAASEAPDPRLTHRIATDLAGAIRYTDREFTDLRDEIEAQWIARDVGFYVTTAAVARAVPDAVDRTLSIFEKSS